MNNSRYNFAIPTLDGTLLYNARTGSVLLLQGQDTREFVEVLCGEKVVFPTDVLPHEVVTKLIAGGFLVPIDWDERQAIQDKYHQARRDTPIVLTITTTMNCNLGCYYCYEERSPHQLTFSDIDAIVALTRERLSRSNKSNLHVDWYGGEPLLNLDFIEATSLALQKLCEELRVRYAASIISNGTCWPDDVATFIRRHRIQQTQISLDGLQAHHDRRRHYRVGYAPGENASSFEQIVALIDKLLDVVRVDIRFNIDRNNAEDVEPFIAFARSRGWFDRAYPAVIQPARLAAFSDRSAFMRKWELSIDEYDVIREKVRVEVNGCTHVEESEAPHGFPFPRNWVCAALANDSVVIGADRQLYRCGLQVGEVYRSVGGVEFNADLTLPIVNNGSMNDGSWWAEFDPTILPSCSRCSFLPICWGGCPKKHLERDKYALDEQSRYWRNNLPRLVAEYLGKEVDRDFMFTEDDQFRDGYD